MTAFSFIRNVHIRSKHRTETNTPHSYAPLKERQIRLLKLNPGASSSPIVCSLHIVSLHDYDDINGWAKDGELRSYDTISYVWGSAKRTFDVDCKQASATCSRKSHG
jgi:hypothetical protein